MQIQILMRRCSVVRWHLPIALSPVWGYQGVLWSVWHSAAGGHSHFWGAGGAGLQGGLSLPCWTLLCFPTLPWALPEAATPGWALGLPWGGVCVASCAMWVKTENGEQESRWFCGTGRFRGQLHCAMTAETGIVTPLGKRSSQRAGIHLMSTLCSLHNTHCNLCF